MVYTQSNSRVIRRILDMYSTYLYEHRTDIKDRVLKFVDNRICCRYINKVVNQMKNKSVWDIPFYPELPFDKKKAYKILKDCSSYLIENIDKFNKIRMEHISDKRVIEIGKQFVTLCRNSRFLNIPFDTKELRDKRMEEDNKYWEKMDIESEMYGKSIMDKFEVKD